VSKYDAHLLIRSRFITNVETPLGGAALVIYENQRPSITDPTIAWVRFVVNWGQAQQVMTGGASGTFRTAGVVEIQVFTPIATGYKLSLQISDIIDAAFRGFKYGGLEFFAMNITKGRQAEGWFMRNVSVPFIYDEQVAYAT
jgi:hypothetical protein